MQSCATARRGGYRTTSLLASGELSVAARAVTRLTTSRAELARTDLRGASRHLVSSGMLRSRPSIIVGSQKRPLIHARKILNREKHPPRRHGRHGDDF